MTKESLQLILSVLSGLTINTKDENFVEAAVAIDKAKKEVKEALNGSDKQAS